MIDFMADTPTKPRRRWLSFSLRSLFVAVSVCGTAGYWLACQAACQRQQRNYERVVASQEVGLTGPAEVCKASLLLFRAEAGIPFADRRSAATSHLDRIAKIRDIAYGPLSEWLMGVADEASLAEAKARKAEIDRYYDEAERMATETR